VCIQINGMNVANASHEYAVQLIREAGNELSLRVVTVSSSESPAKPSHYASTRTDGSAIMLMLIDYCKDDHVHCCIIETSRQPRFCIPLQRHFRCRRCFLYLSFASTSPFHCPEGRKGREVRGKVQ